jgi:hypothetical protein
MLAMHLPEGINIRFRFAGKADAVEVGVKIHGGCLQFGRKRASTLRSF